MSDQRFYGLNYDSIFHIVMQESEKVRRRLAAAVLDYPENMIRECIIENPILYSDLGKCKKSELDVKMRINGNLRLILELQMSWMEGWGERTLLYWCRTYDSIKSGSGYESLMPTIFMGVLNFTLFPDEPEFLSEYKIINTRTGRDYTDKLIIRSMDLTRTELAGESPREQEHLKWAKAFNADTPEKVEELFLEGEVFEEMAMTVLRLNADEEIQQSMRLREVDDWYEAMRPKFEYEAGEKAGIARGKAEGKKEGILQAVRALMKNLKISEEEAFKLIEAKEE